MIGETNSPPIEDGSLEGKMWLKALSFKTAHWRLTFLESNLQLIRKVYYKVQVENVLLESNLLSYKPYLLILTQIIETK